MDTHFRVRNDDVLQVFADQTLKIAGKRLLTLRHQDAHGIYPEMASPAAYLYAAIKPKPDQMNKKLLLLAVIFVAAILTSCASAYQCPTYSKHVEAEEVNS